MYRKMLTGMISLMLFGATFMVPKVQADESDRKTIITVNEPIQVPGKVLPAGTYVLKLVDANDRTLVAIYNADETRLVMMVRGVPGYRTETPSEAILQLQDRPDGGPEALTAWFYPGANTGVEFVYPTK
jgi:hypothetical protein